METTETKLSQQEIVRAAVNDPSLSTRTVELSGRVFPIVDLEYRDNLRFMAKMKPLMELFYNYMTNPEGLPADTPAPAITADLLFKYCENEIPEMALIVLQQTDPAITVEDVMKLGKNPIRLAKVILTQIEQNGMVQDFADFFGQIMPIVTAVMGQKSMAEETLS